MNRIYSWSLAGCFSLSLFSCAKEAVYIETVSVSDDPYLVNIDTFGVSASVFRLDSFLTGNTGLVVSGRHTDPLIGTTTANGYFHFKLAAADYNEVGVQNEFYDSIVFVGKVGPLYYGDTSVPYKVKLHRLSEDIYNETNLYYNVHHFSEEAAPLGRSERTLRPLLGDSVRIRLDDSFGDQLFRYYREKNVVVRTDEEFQRWFKGVKLVPDAAVSGPLYAFSTGDSSVCIRLYYHQDVGVRVAKQLDFYLSGTGKDFTEVNTNTSGTVLETLAPGAGLPVSSIGYRYFYFPLAGIRTGFSFPTIKTIPGYGDFVRLLSAQLALYPGTDNIRTYPLPGELNAYFRLPDLSYEGPLAKTDGSAAQTGDLRLDDIYGVGTFYTWDVPAYISSEMTANLYTERTFVPLSGSTSGALQGSWNSRLSGSLEKGHRTKLSVQLLVHQSKN